ncbi:Vacuolar protein sorting-associated protein 17 [Thecaphora frezii]
MSASHTADPEPRLDSFGPPTPNKQPQPPSDAFSRSNSGLVPDMDQRRYTGASFSNGQPTSHTRNASAVYQPHHHAEPPRELFLRVRIQSIEKAKRDLMVRMDAITNLPHFRSSSYPGFTRSYRELCLYALALSLSSPAVIVPALPLPSTTASGVEDTRILRLMLSRWFSRILAEPVLRDSPETRNLVEADFTYSPTPPGAGSSSAARKRFANAMASAANVAYGGVDTTGGLPNGVLATSASAGTRSSGGGGGFSLLGLGGGSKGLSTSRSVYDDDEELVAARAEVTRLEMQFADAAEASEKLAHARRALTTALSDLSAKFNNLGAVEEVRPPSMRLGLPHALKRTANMAQSIGELQDALSNTELLTLGDAVAYQSINARAAKEAMLARNALVEEHHNAQKATVAKKRDLEHLKTQKNLRADRVDDALEELEEAKRHEVALAQNLKRISSNLHSSLQSHSRHAHHDLQQALLEHAKGSLMYQKQVLKEMQALKPELRPELRARLAAASASPDVTASPNMASAAVRSGSFEAHKPYDTPASPSVHAAPAPPATPSVPSIQSPPISPPQISSRQQPTPPRPNPWMRADAPQPSMTQSFYQPPPPTSPSRGPPPPNHGNAMAQSMFVQPAPTPDTFASRFATLNSGAAGFGSGTASGRSRISASEAARSLAGKF